MAKFKVVIKASAEKELEKLPNTEIAQVLDVIYSLAENPYRDGIKKLKGKKKKSPCFRIRAGNYRILYEVNNHKLIVHVIAVGDRKEIYK
ncbi:MAG: type II toxin-antitoxin system RelE/ParE family toxin [Methylococcales bacterium]|nr:type II toxin-antitoxin system RelE/ParE family toxin [Methylococcales bacterium]MDD5753252.1 type II toxin-antitoxin system RelE/ParE family toxin [Methylococcales bacterium]